MMAEATLRPSDRIADQMSYDNDNLFIRPAECYYEMDSYLQALVNAGCPRFDEVAS
jgi:hypothetical protein